MPITELRVAGYRSVRQIHLKLKPINVLVGPNGCGKTNLYRGIYLLSAAANGELARAIAEEGGMPSVLWAGERKRNERVRMALGVTVGDLSFDMELGLPIPELTVFNLDPKVKEETVTYLDGRSRVTLLERGNASAWARDANGQRVAYRMALSNEESCLSQLAEPHRFPHLSVLRQEFAGWRFYHTFRTDPDSPLRQPQVGVRTPVLSRDGRDLAAALQTIVEIGDAPGLSDAIDRAFPGAKLSIEAPSGRFSVFLRMPGFHRAFSAEELSDGTLRYLCLLAALLSPRPPALLALNEPETSLHPDLLEPLAHLLVAASERSQLWLTTHSQPLADHIGRLARIDPVRLHKVNGETRVIGQGWVEDD